MLRAKEEGEALLKAEVGRLSEENRHLKDADLEHRGTVMALEERLAELTGPEGPGAVRVLVPRLLLLSIGGSLGGGADNNESRLAASTNICHFSSFDLKVTNPGNPGSLI